jgi:hypothetical protein
MVARGFFVCCAALLLTADADAAERTIYRCTVNEVTTFSDRPCGEAIVVHSLDLAASHASVAGAVATERAARPHRPTPKPVRALQATRSGGSKLGSNHASAPVPECARLAAQLQRLRARMRAGYNGTEGERLRELYRTQRARHRALSCT